MCSHWRTPRLIKRPIKNGLYRIVCRYSYRYQHRFPLGSVLITTRKRSLGQGNIYAPVCHSVHGGGGLPQCMLECHPPLPRRPPCQGDTPAQENPPAKETPPPGPHPRGKLWGIRSRPTPKGEIQGDQIQAHTQGGNSGGSDPGPHPRGKFRGIRTSPPLDDYCCGRYTSYWNAFLFIDICVCLGLSICLGVSVGKCKRTIELSTLEPICAKKERTRMHSSRCLYQGVSIQSGLSVRGGAVSVQRGVSAHGGLALGRPLPPVDRMTDRC